MSKSTALLLVGGIVDPGAGQPGAVVAFVAVSGSVLGSRLFKVDGLVSAPLVRELPSATTIDIGRFERDVKGELAPAIHAIESAGGKAALTKPDAAWVCNHVRDHLKKAEGLAVG